MAIALGNFLEVDASQVEEGGAVVLCELVLMLVVSGADPVEVGVDFRLHGVEGVKDSLALVQVLASFGNLLEAEACVGDCCQCVDEGVL